MATGSPSSMRKVARPLLSYGKYFALGYCIARRPFTPANWVHIVDVWIRSGGTTLPVHTFAPPHPAPAHHRPPGKGGQRNSLGAHFRNCPHVPSTSNRHRTRHATARTLGQMASHHATRFPGHGGERGGLKAKPPVQRTQGGDTGDTGGNLKSTLNPRRRHRKKGVVYV